MNRRLPGFMLAALLALTVLGGSEALAAGDQGDKAKFRAAYSRYQQAIENKDPNAAATAAKEALDLGQGILPDDSPSMAALYVNYGMALVDAKRYSDAFAPLRGGIRRMEKLNGRNDESLIDPLWALAEAYRTDAKQSRKAIVNLRRILKLVERTRGKDNFLFAEINQLLGKTLVLLSLGQQRSAPAYLKTAYDTYQRLYNRPAYRTGLAAFWLGKSAMQLRRYEAAEEHFLDALRLFEETSPPGHELQLLAHMFLIVLYEDRGKSSQADAHCQAISLLRQNASVDGHKPLYKKVPVYPASALQFRREGWVLVEFSVTTRGTVANVSVVESKGAKSLERAALEAVKYFRYAPAVQNGKLVNTDGVRNLITFEIG